MIRYFRSKHYPLIEHPSAASIQETETAYLDFLEDLPASLTEAMNHSGREIEAKHSDFLKTEGPKEFASLAESIEAHMPIRQSFSGRMGKEDWDELLSSLAPFDNQWISLCPPRITLIRGRHFPRNRRNFVARTGSHDNSHRAWSFLRIFLAEYGKPGKFLSLVRLVILNLAGVPSSSSDFWFRIVRYFS